MADQSELEHLAKEYMDLWQEHLNSINQDEKMVDLIAKSMTMMNSGTAAFANVVAEAAQSSPASDSNQTSRHSDHAENDKTDPPSSHSDRATPAALSSGHPNPDMDQLFGRIAILEKRVAELEQLCKPSRSSNVRARKRPAKTSPKV